MKISPFTPKRLVNNKDLKEACQAEITFLTEPTPTTCLFCCPIFLKPTKAGRYKKFINQEAKTQIITHFNAIIELLIRRCHDYYQAIDFDNSTLQDLLGKLFKQINTGFHGTNNAELDDLEQQLLNQPPIYFNHPTLNQVQTEAINFFIEKERIEEESKCPHIAHQRIYRH